MQFFVAATLALLSPLPQALASLQSPAFKIHSSYATPSAPSLVNLYISSYNYHPGPFYYAILADPSSQPPMVGYLNGTDSDSPGELTLEFINVIGAEGTAFGFSFDPSGAKAPYTPVTLNYGAGTKGVTVGYGELRYDGDGFFFACTNAEAGGPQGQLFYIKSGGTVPNGCSELILDITYD